MFVRMYAWHTGGIMLKGKSAIVTGSTSGIGLGIAQALAEQGVHILFNGFGDRAQIDALVADTAKTLA